MRKIFLFMDDRLDGCFEAPGHDLSAFTNEDAASSPESSEKVDALLFGRRTLSDDEKVLASPLVVARLNRLNYKCISGKLNSFLLVKMLFND